VEELLTREKFKEAVFNRDNCKCVICGEPPVDAHHIIDRALWPDGGYYLSNGASLCADHHWHCETGKISPDELRAIIGIPPLLPPQLDPDFTWDKWGTPRATVTCPYCGQDTKGRRSWSKIAYVNKPEGYLVMCEHCRVDFIVNRKDKTLETAGIPRVKMIGKTEKGRFVFDYDEKDSWTKRELEDGT